MTETHDVRSTMSGPRLHLAFELNLGQWKLALAIGHGQPARLSTIAARALRHLPEPEDACRFGKRDRPCSLFPGGAGVTAPPRT